MSECEGGGEFCEEYQSLGCDIGGDNFGEFGHYP